MKNILKFNLILITICFITQNIVLAADYNEELLTNPVDNSILEDTTKTPSAETQEKKKFKITGVKFWNKNNKKVREEKAVTDSKNDDSKINLTSDHLDYFPERSEIEAVGNAKVKLPNQPTTIEANKIIFNHDLNTLKAYDNVKIIDKSSVTTGDFLNLNLNEGNGWLKAPVTKNTGIILRAEEGNIYSDRIEEYNGVAKIIKDYDLAFGSPSFANFVNPGRLDFGSDSQAKIRSSQKESGVYRIKAKVIYIDSRDEHNVLKMTNADLYAKNIKLGSVPNVKIVTNKEHQFFETNVPEFGSLAELGMYVGPGIVLNTPHASTLKLTPIFTYGESEAGIGGLARFRNSSNMTELGYSSSTNKFLLRGSQNIAGGVRLVYSQNAYQDEWFMGYRKPRYSAALQLDKKYYLEDLKMTFEQRLQGGFFVDKDKNFNEMEGRLRWQTQTQKTLYSYYNDNKDFNLRLGIIGQTAMSLYTTGDNMGVIRVGPALRTSYKNWTQDVMYFQSATAGSSPFEFDKYVYGKSNVVLIESLRLCRYLTVGYIASIVMNKEYHTDNAFQENRMFFSVGPDYAKLTFGYDAFRQSTSFVFSTLVGTKDSEVEFKKAVLKNPDTLNKTKEHKVNLLHKFVKTVFPEVKDPNSEPATPVVKPLETDKMQKGISDIEQ